MARQADSYPSLPSNISDAPRLPISAPPSIRTRPFDPAIDLANLVQLLNTCSTYDQVNKPTSIARLERQLAAMPPGSQRYWQVWEQPDYGLVAIGFLFLPKRMPTDPSHEVYGDFEVRPEWRDRGLEAEILRWMETTAVTLRPRNRPIPYRIAVSAIQTPKLNWLQSQGYEAVRQFNELERSLQVPTPPPEVPPGFQLRAIQPTDPPDRWVELFNQAFVDHWNHHPLTVEQYHYHLTQPGYHADLDWLAIAPDGTLAAFCVGHIDALDNQLQGEQVGWVQCLGTRRGYRRLGLARALLLQQLALLRQAGMQVARLGVDAENPNQAYALYESVGFTPTKSTIALLKVAQPADAKATAQSRGSHCDLSTGQSDR